MEFCFQFIGNLTKFNFKENFVMLQINNNQKPESRIYILHHQTEGKLKYSSETQKIDHHTILNRFKDLCLTVESGLPLFYVVF